MAKKVNRIRNGIVDTSKMRMYRVELKNMETGKVFECIQAAESIAALRDSWKQLKGKTGKYEFIQVKLNK